MVAISMICVYDIHVSARYIYIYVYIYIYIYTHIHTRLVYMLSLPSTARNRSGLWGFRLGVADCIETLFSKGVLDVLTLNPHLVSRKWCFFFCCGPAGSF